ncbi:MAG: TonB-dependent receptor, partial [Pseudomonadota bacterium]
MTNPSAARRALAIAAVAAAAAHQSALAESPDQIVVTGLKGPRAQTLQDAPVAVSSFSASELDGRQVRSLTALSFAAPNVALDDIGTTPGTANFSIRGIGVNSSIASIDPTVGVFVDGVYMGVNAGVVLDTFDLESVEILRGPQGLLFGRNVTGGAVLVRTKRPSEELSIEARAAVSSGPEKLVSASVSGPILEDRLGLKFAVYGSDDDGYFTNLFDGSAFGEDRTRLFRAAADWRGSETFDLIARVESGRSEGDGPAAQSRGLFDRNSFDFSIDERGLHDNEWESASLEANWRVGFGDGTITNVLGWRRYDQTTLADIDSSPDLIFVSATFLEQEQYSNELRYAGRFADRADLTAGLYYFTQDIAYQETRLIPILPPERSSQYGGGLQDQNTFGAFAQSDIDLTSDVTLTLGLRYTYEEKSAVIGTVRALGVAVDDPLLVPAGACNALIGECVDPVTGADLFVRDSESWSNLTPKIGGQWRISDDLQVYGFWTRGFRSGGYNVR